MPRELRLIAFVLVSGGVVMALELLGGRMLASVFGSSIFVWGSLIGIILSSLSVGYFLGGKLADWKPDLQTLAVMIFAAGLLILALPSFARPVFDLAISIHLGERYAPLLASALTLAGPSVLLGTVSPYAIRLAAKSFEKLGKVSGNLYALSTFGSILGTFLTVFVLIPTFGVNKIIFSLGMVLLVMAFFGLGFRLKVLVLLILVIAPFAAPYLVSRQLTVATYSLALGDTVYATDTPYHHVLVADAFDPQYQSTIRYLILDDNFHSAMDLNNPDRTVFPYTDYFNLAFLVNPNITRVLFIGGGGFTGPKFFLKHYPSVSVDVAEIDPEVIRVAKQYFNVDPSNPRLHIYNDDGRIYLQTTLQKYDLVVLDAYSKSYVPFQLMTSEFFQLLADHLNSNGCVVSNLISRESGDGSQLLNAEVRTIHAFFPAVYTFAVKGPDFSDLQNIIILANLSPNQLSMGDFQLLASNSTLRPVSLRDDATNYFLADTSSAPILTDNFAPVETLLNPISGQPLSAHESAAYAQDMVKLLGVVVAVTAVIAILWKKKVL